MLFAQGREEKKNERNADMSVAGPAAGWILAASPVLGKICLPHEGQADTATFINQWFIGGLSRPTSKTTWLKQLFCDCGFGFQKCSLAMVPYN